LQVQSVYQSYCSECPTQVNTKELRPSNTKRII